MSKRVVLVAVCCAVLLVAVPVQADYIVVANSATAHHSISGRGPEKTLNGSGISDASIIEDGDDIPVTWPTVTGNYLTEWQANKSGGGGWLQYDLGEVQDITGLYVWNSRNGTARGMRNVTVKTSETLPGDWGTVAATGNWQFSQAAGGARYDFATTQTARYVLLDAADNWGDGSFIAVNEVRFIGIPEPASTLLMATGGLVMLRHRS